jgi:hypothetical protein
MPLAVSINVTLDGCCDHLEMLADEDLHRHAAENLDQADAGRVKLPLGLAELGLIDEYEFEPRSLRRVRPQGQLPMQRKTFGAVLKHIVQDLEPGREYTEKQINTLLKHRHPDTASLRRGMIDFRLMERKSGVYWPL